MKTIVLLCLAAGLLAQSKTPAPPAAPKKPTEVPAPAPEKPVDKPTGKPVEKASEKKETAKLESPAGEPKAAKGESLHYNVNWPSGLSLGEAELTSSGGKGPQSFSFKMDASVPGFAISESATSRATAEYCSLELKKQGTRGKRKVDERTEFDQAALKATRTTEGGGKSELSLSPCAKDAVTFVNFLRRELAGGRLPAQQKVYYGGAYSVRVTFVGTQRIPIGSEAVDADKLTATIKGPATELTADLFFAKDAGRTPLLVQVPLAVGTFKMEIAR